MKYFFEDFDKLRKGFCTEVKVQDVPIQFRSGLSIALYFLNINLTDEDFNRIIEKYAMPG